MRVLRVEDGTGQGPYISKSGEWCYAFREPICVGFVQRPCPAQDGIPSISKEYNCGFLNKKQYTDWFPETSRMALDRQGYKLIEYEVKSWGLIMGEYQVVFDRNNSRKIAELCPITLREKRKL